MSDKQLKVKVSRIVAQSGFEKSADLVCPVLKVLQMRHKDIDKVQALRIVNEVLGS